MFSADRADCYHAGVIFDRHHPFSRAASFCQVGDRKTLVAFFTFANKPKFYQAMAYSTDGGDTWKYHNNGRAVVDNQGFDNGGVAPGLQPGGLTGDLGWNPLNFDVTEEIQLKELQNGRAAMIAISAWVFHDAIPGSASPSNRRRA